MNQRYRKRNTAAFTGVSYFALAARSFSILFGGVQRRLGIERERVLFALHGVNYD